MHYFWFAVGVNGLVLAEIFDPIILVKKSMDICDCDWLLWLWLGWLAKLNEFMFTYGFDNQMMDSAYSLRNY